MPFLFLSEETALTTPTRASGPIPPRCPPAHPERLYSTGSRAGRARCKADRPQQTTHQHDTPGRWTRCTGLHPIPDRPRRVDRDGGIGWRACSASETVQIWTGRTGIQSQTLKSVQCCARNLTRTLKSVIIMPETNEH